MIRSNGSVRAEPQRLAAVAHRLGGQALEAEVQRDQLADVRLVFDDEDAGALQVLLRCRLFDVHKSSVASPFHARHPATVSSQSGHRRVTGTPSYGVRTDADGADAGSQDPALRPQGRAGLSSPADLQATDHGSRRRSREDTT